MFSLFPHVNLYFLTRSPDFSRMRSKGSRFTLLVWGLRVCSLDVAFASATVRNRPQPFATVRYPPQPSAPSPYGRAYGKFCKRGHFWRFHMWHCFVLHGRRGTSWHSDVFGNVSKVVLCGTRNTFATFSEDVLQFSWQAQHFARFFASRIVRAASSGDKVQIPWQAWHFVRCDENRRRPRTKHWFSGSKFSGSKENSWESIDFEATKCQNWRTTRKKSWFWCSHVSCLGSLVFLWPRRVYGGSCKTSSFRRFPSRLSCRFAWQERRCVTFQPVW